MDEIELLIDLHRQGFRQGPGSDKATQQALELSQVGREKPLHVADIGCGTGASTLALARLLPNARITAVDLFPEFLDVLKARADEQGLAQRVTTLVCSMDKLPFRDGEFDLIWSEGAIYNIGFANGIGDWRRLLKANGLLVVSEITWLSESRPEEVQSYWDSQYPEIDTASAKMQVLEHAAYSPIAFFALPQSCWLENYYRPLQSRFDAFLERHSESEEAARLVELEQKEIAFYEKYSPYYSYGMYVCRNVG
ncbi:class I SAM-dependent methyltransferase [Parahaliea mediterranea]|uniref:Methyltransferase domain-containing protein n=1 Tax=Parahaliea mediterranea TaxID=651086 RepID=A0A939DCV8_9GAMM|nr:class I SAM-dependent methyltransferase [Parahaliea mediterranea]MBN7795893.1 methyltransferase domain-containing protein [Parahaliea mediterranea]